MAVDIQSPLAQSMNDLASNFAKNDISDFNNSAITAATANAYPLMKEKDVAVSNVEEVKADVAVLPSHAAIPTIPQPVNAVKPGLFITGLGHQYPPFTFKPDRLESFLKRWYDVEHPAIQKLLQINQTTQINSRSVLIPPSSPFWSRSVPPSCSELDSLFRTSGVSLTVQAAKRALRDCTPPVPVSALTHLVAVTCTNAGNPGFDLLVAKKLGADVQKLERTLLHGVGCAGGLSALRQAASLAQSHTARGRPARVLVVACEVCSVNVRCDMDEMMDGHSQAQGNTDAAEAATKISPVLFSDGAAAFVLENEIATRDCGEQEDEGTQRKGVYELIDWETATMPDTQGVLEFMVDPIGWRATLTKEVPVLAQAAIGPMFQRLLPYLPADSELAKSKQGKEGEKVEAKEFDWALHPGGIAILNGVKNMFEMQEDDQLRASFDVYRNHGNSSSPTVLVVLDQLRKMGEGRENVMACSFGPGMTIEMAMLKRVRHAEEEY